MGCGGQRGDPTRWTLAGERNGVELRGICPGLGMGFLSGEVQCQSLGTPLCWMPGDGVFQLLQGVGRLAMWCLGEQRNGHARGEGHTYQHAHTPTSTQTLAHQSQLPQKGCAPRDWWCELEICAASQLAHTDGGASVQGLLS